MSFSGSTKPRRRPNSPQEDDHARDADRVGSVAPRRDGGRRANGDQWHLGPQRSEDRRLGLRGGRRHCCATSGCLARQRSSRGPEHCRWTGLHSGCPTRILDSFCLVETYFPQRHPDWGIDARAVRWRRMSFWARVSSVGPFAVVGEGCRLDDNVVVYPGTYVGPGLPHRGGMRPVRERQSVPSSRAGARRGYTQRRRYRSGWVRVSPAGGWQLSQNSAGWRGPHRRRRGNRRQHVH